MARSRDILRRTETPTIILGVTGSIAAYRSCEIIRRLRERGCAVKVIMTAEAEAFITPLTLQTLSGNRVHRAMLAAADASWSTEHISLAQEACAVVVAPATANIIGKMAHGLADDLLTCTLLATKAPVLLAPAMNEGMYAHRIVQANIAALAKAGVRFVEPIQGALACGDVGLGHIAETPEIIQAALELI